MYKLGRKCSVQFFIKISVRAVTVTNMFSGLAGLGHDITAWMAISFMIVLLASSYFCLTFTSIALKDALIKSRNL
jgi:hypothetical protein